MDAERPRRAVTRRNEALTNKSECTPQLLPAATEEDRYWWLLVCAIPRSLIWESGARAREGQNSTRGRSEVENLRRRARARNSTRVFSFHRATSRGIVSWERAMPPVYQQGARVRTGDSRRAVIDQQAWTLSPAMNIFTDRLVLCMYVHYIIRSRLQLKIARRKYNRRRSYRESERKKSTIIRNIFELQKYNIRKWELNICIYEIELYDFYIIT